MQLKVPRGSTQKKVNEVIYDQLKERFISLNGLSKGKYLDVPCGHGAFANFIKQQHPNIDVTGIDLFEVPNEPKFNFHKAKAQQYFANQPDKKFDVISCISGIMCFDGAADFLVALSESLNKGGVLVVTNDNIMTARDRLHFLFFGRFKRFNLTYQKFEGNWNVVLPQGVIMILQRAELKNFKIRYTSFYIEDFIFLPVALLIYPIFAIYLATRKSDLSLKEKFELFPPSSLMARHYVVFAEKP